MEFATWLIANDSQANSSLLIEQSSTNADFETWFLTNGGYIHPSIEIASSPASGNLFRVVPEENLPPANTVVSCPHSLALSWPNARKLHYPDVRLPPCPQHVATRLFLMKQKLLKQQSPWWPYIKMLPESFNTPLYYNSEDFAWIQGTNLGHARNVRRDAWQEEYDEAMRTVLPKGMAEEQRKLWTWELYLWAATVMTSRSFFGPAVFNQPVGKLPTRTDDSDEKTPVLIPGLDLLNHNPSSRVTWLWDAGACIIKTNEPLAGGSEVLNNYGSKSNEELIMGYGFSLPDNPADHFGIDFTPAIAAYINATKALRATKSGESLPVQADSLKQENPENTRAHWICVRDMEPEFSPGFLEDFSIALENPRESFRAVLCPQSTFDLLDSPLSRNKLHVICAILMILQKGELAIRRQGQNLPKPPQNTKQDDAARYRNKQLDILDRVVESLTKILSPLSDEEMSIVKGANIVRLEDALKEFPKRLLKDLRSVLNTGMKSRDPHKIKERGGTDFAFTVWLCGLWISQQPHAEEDQDRELSGTGVRARLLQWLCFLHQFYPYHASDGRPPLDLSSGVKVTDRAQWLDPVRNQASGRGAISDVASTVASYMDAIHATVDKHPQSIYKNPAVTETRLAWCYNVIKHEGVWFPNLTDKEEDDEWVLFLEGEDDQTG